jgi:hypothetical protein
VASAAHCTGWRHIGFPAFAARKAGRGNDRVWKAWKAMKHGFPPFPHYLENPFGIPHSHGRDDWIYVFSCLLNPNRRHRKGLVTDVSGPQRNACSGTLTPLRSSCRCFQKIRAGVAVGTRLLRNSLLRPDSSLMQPPSAGKPFRNTNPMPLR